MSFAKLIRWDLGVRKLAGEWKNLFKLEGLREDITAGIVVACVALPLSLAIALASSVAPAIGLTTAIIAGVVCAIFGGTRLAVSGPAAAMAVLVGNVVEQHQMNGLFIVALGCGALQLLSGSLGLGRFLRFVPATVVHGFTAGVGAIILIGQLPRLLGLPPPDEAHVFNVISHLGEFIHKTKISELGLSLFALTVTVGLPRIYSKIPSAIVAVVACTAAATLMGLPVATIGAIPESLAQPYIPELPKENWSALISATFVIFAVASLETLLSSSAVDNLKKGERHDPDQELIGQGLGNVVVSFFSGIPVTGVIVRSSVNVLAGAKTRRSSLIHSGILALSTAVLAPWMSRIPVAALAGILVSVALRMLDVSHLRELWRVSRSEAFVFLLTFFALVFVDLLVGVQSGVVAALVIAAVRLGSAEILIHDGGGQDPLRVTFGGSLTFLAAGKVDEAGRQLNFADPRRGVVFDLSAMSLMDTSGAEHLRNLLRGVEQRGTSFALVGLHPRVRDTLIDTEEGQHLAERVAVTETDIAKLIHTRQSEVSESRLLAGVERFQTAMHSSHEALFDRLAEGQSPHTMLITCVDSRISPNWMTHTDPGELFIVRNLGNYVPQFGSKVLLSEGAAVEYAVRVLGVKQVIVCGHARCGAVGALANPAAVKDFAAFEPWLEAATPWFSEVVGAPADALDQAGRRHVAQQIRHLRSYPFVEDAVNKGDLILRAWYFDIHNKSLEQWDEETDEFVNILLQDHARRSRISEINVPLIAIS